MPTKDEGYLAWFQIYEQETGFFVIFKLHVSEWCRVAVNKASVTLDYILTEAVYPDPGMPLSHYTLYWVDHSSSIRFHFGLAYSDVIDSLEASR